MNKVCVYIGEHTTKTAIQLIFWFNPKAFTKEHDFVCKIAKNLQDRTAGIESGFEYVTEMEAVKLFRKESDFKKGFVIRRI